MPGRSNGEYAAANSVWARPSPTIRERYSRPSSVANHIRGLLFADDESAKTNGGYAANGHRQARRAARAPCRVPMRVLSGGWKVRLELRDRRVGHEADDPDPSRRMARDGLAAQAVAYEGVSGAGQ